MLLKKESIFIWRFNLFCTKEEPTITVEIFSKIVSPFKTGFAILLHSQNLAAQH